MWTTTWKKMKGKFSNSPRKIVPKNNSRILDFKSNNARRYLIGSWRPDYASGNLGGQEQRQGWECSGTEDSQPTRCHRPNNADRHLWFRFASIQRRHSHDETRRRAGP